MKKLLKQISVSLLSTAIGLAVLSTPLVSTAYAADTTYAATNNSDWGQHDNDENHHQRNDQDNRDYRHHYHWINHSEFARHHMELYRYWQYTHQVDTSLLNPLDVVKAVADVLGFDANDDTFNLVSQDDSQAIVQVIHNNTIYNITVDHPSNSSWVVTSMAPVE